jgi:hypothetical protein
MASLPCWEHTQHATNTGATSAYLLNDVVAEGLVAEAGATTVAAGAATQHGHCLGAVHDLHSDGGIEAQAHVVARHASDLADGQRLLARAQETVEHVRGPIEDVTPGGCSCATVRVRAHSPARMVHCSAERDMVVVVVVCVMVSERGQKRQTCRRRVLAPAKPHSQPAADTDTHAPRLEDAQLAVVEADAQFAVLYHDDLDVSVDDLCHDNLASDTPNPRPSCQTQTMSDNNNNNNKTTKQNKTKTNQNNNSLTTTTTNRNRTANNDKNGNNNPSHVS